MADERDPYLPVLADRRDPVPVEKGPDVYDSGGSGDFEPILIDQYDSSSEENSSKGIAKPEEDYDEEEARARRKRRAEEEETAARDAAGRGKKKPGGYISDSKTLDRIERSKSFFRRFVVLGIHVGHGVYWQNGHLHWIKEDKKLTERQAEVIVQQAIKAGWRQLDVFAPDKRSYDAESAQVLQSVLAKYQNKPTSPTGTILREQPLGVYTDKAPVHAREPGKRRYTLGEKFENAIEKRKTWIGDNISYRFNSFARAIKREQKAREFNTQEPG
jgi:hypothetical protein